jgi:hypothetical protein
MKTQFLLTTSIFAAYLIVPAVEVQAIGTALYVDSYTAGSTAQGGYTSPLTAVGSPERFTGENVFDGVVSPFNPPFLTSELVSIGEGGQITLQLSHFVNPDASGPEIGVFTNAGLVDVDGSFLNPAATASATPVATFGADSTEVEVSEDGISWTSLGVQLYDMPTSGYTDLTNPFSSTPGSVDSSFDQPFTGSVSDFAGLDYFDAGATDVLDVLNGSGGGTWLDISATGLSQIAWIRFSVADDGLVGTGLNFELDAVTISANALGSLVPEPTSTTLLALALAAACSVRMRRKSL